MTSLLLKGGTVLQHDSDNHVKSIKADILVEGNKIVKIEQNITASGAKVIDCQDKIISPGFIDTHHHLWQTQMRGRHGDQTLLEYMATGNLQSNQFTATDVFWGQLGGCQEAIDSGTTTILDHAHMTNSADHAKLGLAASVTSGVRSVFAYAPIVRIENWDPLTPCQNIFEDWVMQTFEELAKAGPYENGRVQLGFAFDLWFLPKEYVLPIFEKVESLGIQVLTSHCARGGMAGEMPTGLQAAESMGLLSEKWVWSHANNILPEEYELIRKSKGKISSTPSTELQMVIGEPSAFKDEAKDIIDLHSWGVDCHTNHAGSMITEMRLGLQAARAYSNEKYLAAKKVPKTLDKTIEQAFNLGTIYGARALGMENEIGSIAVGKLADLVIFDGLSPALVCASEHDPLTAVVMHSSTRDIDTVIVDGQIRKSEGKLLSTEVHASAREAIKKDTLTWRDVARELVRSRAEIQAKIDKFDEEHYRKSAMQMFQLNPDMFVDSL